MRSFLRINKGLCTGKLHLHAQLGSVLVGTEQHVQQTGQNDDGHDGADDAAGAHSPTAELVDHQGDQVSEAALIADGEPRPLGVVHLTH